MSNISDDWVSAYDFRLVVALRGAAALLARSDEPIRAVARESASQAIFMQMQSMQYGKQMDFSAAEGPEEDRLVVLVHEQVKTLVRLQQRLDRQPLSATARVALAAELTALAGAGVVIDDHELERPTSRRSVDRER